jgi:transposase
MSRAIGLRDDYTANEVRRLAAKSKDANQSRRLLAIAGIYDGMSRTEAAKIGGMDRQTLRDWVHRFNEQGPDGLIDRRHEGPAPKLSSAQKAELAKIVEAGPDLDKDGVVRWRGSDLKTVIEARFGVTYTERSVSRILHELGFAHLSVRPRHPAQDQEVIAAFKKTSPPRWPLTSAMSRQARP